MKRQAAQGVKQESGSSKKVSHADSESSSIDSQATQSGKQHNRFEA
jgi:hypothetical protein